MEILKEYKSEVRYKTKNGDIHIYPTTCKKKVQVKITRSEIVNLIDQVDDYEDRVKVRDYIQSIIDAKNRK